MLIIHINEQLDNTINADTLCYDINYVINIASRNLERISSRWINHATMCKTYRIRGFTVSIDSFE